MIPRPARIACILLGLAVAATRPSPVGAECTVSTPNDGGSILTSSPEAPAGQSFVACQDGVITYLAISITFSPENPVVLGIREGTNLLENTYVFPGAHTGSQSLRFAPGIPVESGKVYSFSIAPVAGILRLLATDPRAVPDGTALVLQNGVTQNLNSDLQFWITIADPEIPAEAATWGMVKSLYR